MERNSHIAVVDLQGFPINEGKHLVLKELAFSFINTDNKSDHPSANNNEIYHYIFKSPFNFKQLSRDSQFRVRWQGKYYNGLGWTDGEIPYEQISECIQPLLQKDLLIYVKGSDNLSWLLKLSKQPTLNIINVEDLGCTFRLSDMNRIYKHQFHCKKHQLGNHCARQDVKIVEKWVCKNIIWNQ